MESSNPSGRSHALRAGLPLVLPQLAGGAVEVAGEVGVFRVSAQQVHWQGSGL